MVQLVQCSQLSPVPHRAVENCPLGKINEAGSEPVELGVRGRSQTTFTRFGFFWPPSPLRLHFLWYESLQKVDFFDHLPPSSCKRSL